MANMSGTVTISPLTGEAMDICWATNLAKSSIAIAALSSTQAQSQSWSLKRWLNRLLENLGFGRDKVAVEATKKQIKNVLFGLRVSTPMFGEEDNPDPKNFAGRRVAFPLDYRISRTSVTQLETPKEDDLLSLFDHAVKWALGIVNTRQFDEVFREEWQEVYKRRITAYSPRERI